MFILIYGKKVKKNVKEKKNHQENVQLLTCFYFTLFYFFLLFSFYFCFLFYYFLYSAVSGVDEHKRRQGKGQYVGFVTEPLTAGGTPIDPGVLPNFPGLNASQTNTAVFHTLFPNVFYFLLPSHMFVVRLGKVLKAR